MRCSRRRPGVLLTPAFLVLLAGCAPRLPDVSPADIPAIRAELDTRPDDLELRTRLGIALNRAGDHAEAVDVLTAVIEEGVGSGAAFLYLGLSQEALENWTGAREAYARYIEVGRFDPLKDELRGRLAMIVREELRAQARESLAQEAQISAQPPTPRSVAVFPMAYVSGPPELEPLQVAMADMMITDLSQARSLTVLERTQIQSLIDEMALTESGLTEPATGARAGRVLRSEHVVQGALTALGTQGMRLDADLLRSAQGTNVGEVTAEEDLEAIFDLEKTAVFEVLSALGVELTEAEREAIDENRTASLQAFLAYGRGLQALDRGDYQAAQQFFQEAAALDPGFGPAQLQLQEAIDLIGASETPLDQLAQRATEEVEREVFASGGVATPAGQITVAGELGGTLTHVAEGVDPTPNSGTIDRASPQPNQPGEKPAEQEQQQAQQTRRQPVPESRGQEQPAGTTTATVRITIPRPGGE